MRFAKVFIAPKQYNNPTMNILAEYGNILVSPNGKCFTPDGMPICRNHETLVMPRVLSNK